MSTGKLRIAINGFGRIGRMTAREILDRPELELIAVNDLAELNTLAHLFRYDSVHGRYARSIKVEEGGIETDGHFVRFLNQKDPASLPWKELDIDLVIESTGVFKTAKEAQTHLDAGARRVIISAPSPDTEVPMVVLGVNDHILEERPRILSNASCTTNSAAPMIALLDELCGIESCYITTVHSYTGDQRLHDAPHKDLRRARAAAMSIVPTTTGAAKALTRIFPHLGDVMGGCGMRVPVPDGSLTDITSIVRNPITVQALNDAFLEASRTRFQGILQYTEDPIVSVDILGNSYSCIFDAQLTSVIGKMVKIVGWYDNEVGYSNRLTDLALRMAQEGW